MSLTARIVIDPSRSIAWAQRLVPAAGIVLAAVTLVARWPALSAAWIALATCSVAAVVLRQCAAPPTTTLDVSARAEIDARIGDTVGTYRLAESTVVWPGFAMLALARDGESRVAVRRAVVLDELRAADRRSLQRFLVWALRARGPGGVGRPAERKSGI